MEKSIIMLGKVAGDLNRIRVRVFAADTSSLTELMGIIMWVVRLSILAIGFIPSFKKLVEAKAEEDTRSEQKAWGTIIFTAIIFAATFLFDGFIEDRMTEVPSPE